MTVYAFTTEVRSTVTPEERALAAYAEVHGWPKVQFVNVATLETLAPTMNAGDVVLITSLETLDERPSKQHAFVMGLLSRGVAVHALSLNGPIEAHLLPLRQAWQAASRLEARVDALTDQAARREQQMQEEMDLFESEVVSRMAQQFGVKELMKKLPPIPSPSDPREPTIGERIRTMREKLGMTLQDLADIANTSKPTLSRLERDEGGAEATERVLAALEKLTSVVPNGEAIPTAIAAPAPEVTL